jgi:hypothetical protein
VAGPIVRLGGEQPTHLRGPLGFTQPIARPSTLVGSEIAECRWESLDGKAYEIEILISVVALNGLGADGFTSLRWQLMSVSHGSVAHDPPPGQPTSLNLCSWAFPARGVRARIAASGCILRVSNAATVSNPPTIRASMQPVLSGQFTVYPLTDMRLAQAAATQIERPPVIPAGAREMKFNSLTVDPSTIVQLLDFDMAPLFNVPITQLAEWIAIPNEVAYWWPVYVAGPVSSVCAVYR